MNEEKMKGFLNNINSKIISKTHAAKDFCIKNKYKVCTGFVCAVLLAAFFSYMALSSKGKSKLLFSFESVDSESGESGKNGESSSGEVTTATSPVDLTESSPVIALNRAAKASKISGTRPATAYFVFSEEQKNLISGVIGAHTGGGNAAFCVGGNGAFELSVHVDKIASKRIAALKNASVQMPFSFGYLYENDFEGGKLKKTIESRPLVSTDLQEFVSENGEDFTIGMCLSPVSSGSSGSPAGDNPEYLKNIPCGFFVYSALPVSFTKIVFGKAKIGFDLEKAFYSFAPNGGTFSRKMTSFDFSGASMVFPAQNTKAAIMPQYLVKFKKPSESNSDEASSTSNESLFIETINFESEKFKFYRTLNSNQSDVEVIPASSLHQPFGTANWQEDQTLLSSIIMTSSSEKLLTFSEKNVLKPFECDPGLIIGWKAENWRSHDYELFEWNKFPGVLIFDTRSYAVQDAFFRRLAFYVEKAGYRGRLLTDMELGSKHGYNAHDYSAESLASFFNKAYKDGFALNQKEYLLCEILLANGVIVKNSDGTFTAGQGALISISQQSPEYLRRQFIAHECWHGIFFIDAEFRNAVGAVYYTMDQTCLEFLKVFWETQPGLGYDLADTYLMHNELMAYLMQQGTAYTKPYFNSLAKRPSVQRNQKELADYVLAVQSAGFEDAAKILDTYAFDNWCFNAGRVWLVSR